MPPIDDSRLLAAGLHLIATLAWVILARSSWRSRAARPLGDLLRLFRLLSAIVAAHYALNVVIDLIRVAPGVPAGSLWLITCYLAKATTLAELAVLRHLLPLATLGGRPPGRMWLAANYGSAVLVGLAIAGLGIFTPAAASLVHAYLLAMTAAIVLEMLQLVRGRSGEWRPLILANLSPRGFAVLGAGMFAVVVAIVLAESSPGADLLWAVLHSAIGLALAAVFAIRILGDVMRRMAVAVASIAAASAFYFGARLSAAAEPRDGLRWLLDAGAVLALALFLGPASSWLKAGVDRWLLRRSRSWDQRLQSFLRTQQPEVGVDECRRRSIAEVARVLQLRGAGMIDTGDDFVAAADGPAAARALPPDPGRPARCCIFAHGRLEPASLAEVWPRGAAARELPDRPFDLLWLRDLELQQALYDAGVTWVVPVISPRRSWGHLLVAAGPLGIAAGGERLATLESFAGQLALVLDSADLLDRAVAVERQLARAAQLAAVGEMAARMAHEIRNPVTAARSLAQQLARDPDSPLNAEHAVIITRELDRVEHQVRTLLDFARRETYRFEELRLAALVDSTLDEVGPRLIAAEDGIDLDRDLDFEVAVRGDPERLRQVLINLVGNAVDALRETAGRRRLNVSVAAGGTSGVELAVRDSGPGVPAELLPRLFEPFVSDKVQGTGLGLAIARRIVEAHGGRIGAQPAAGGGVVFRVTLPRLARLAEGASSGGASDDDPGLRRAV